MWFKESLENKMDLYISIKEAEEILLTMPKFIENPSLIYQLEKVSEGYEISNSGQKNELVLKKSDLDLLLNAPLGLIYEKKKYNLQDTTKFKVELKRHVKYWRIDNE